ncbi:MAG: DUF2306 domain-containing protein [Burkholderiaceae bacterium]
MPSIHPSAVRASFDSLPFGIPVRRIFWIAAILLVVALVGQAMSRFLVVTPTSYGPLWPNRAWLLPHLLGGALALLAGLLQFWAALRRRHPAMHRWIGRAYLVGVAISAASAYALSLRAVLGWAFGTATFVMASVWVGTTLMAFVAIRTGQVAAHREWMLRSYVVALGFVFFRLMVVSPLLTGLGSLPERYTALLWLSWTVPLFVAEVILQWRRSVPAATGIRAVAAEASS